MPGAVDRASDEVDLYAGLVSVSDVSDNESGSDATFREVRVCV